MRTRYGSSPWLHAVKSRRPTHPRFRGDWTADVVVIGAGITGCAVAHACAKEGLDTVVLEATRIGQGSTARGAGLLSTEPGPLFRDIVAAHGLRDARRIFESWRRGSAEGASLLRRLRIPCQLSARDTVVMARDEDARLLRREFDAREAAGFGLSWQTPRQLHARTRLDRAGGIRVPGGFTLDPYRACLGLASAAVRQGAEVFERSRVKKVRFTRTEADVVTERGTIRAGRVIVTTGSATAEFTPLRRHFTRRESYCVLTEPVSAGVRKQLADPALVLCDRAVPPHRFRWVGDRLLIVGADQRETTTRAKRAVLVQRTGQLMYELLVTYPMISGLRPEYGWDAAYGESTDGLMYIGAHRNYPHHLFALGGSGSATGAFVAARVLLNALRGTPDKTDLVFGWTR
ncbi:MAG: FAD-dependent oxidoreductase [Acidobacteria bacterium]|nr:FAD-dependent oxidoreductase [Acidobacteriota bacterium]